MGVYSAIWRKVKELNPNALQKIQSVMSDYERAAMTIAREVFPNSRLTGCWFHFNQVQFCITYKISMIARRTHTHTFNLESFLQFTYLLVYILYYFLYRLY